MASATAEFEELPGNYLARRMKAIQERSSSVFVGKASVSAAGEPAFDRFATEYNDEYQSRPVFEQPLSAAVIRRMQEDGKGRKPFSAPAAQRFNLWKIPSRLLEEEEFAKIQRRKDSLKEEKAAGVPRLPYIGKTTAAVAAAIPAQSQPPPPPQPPTVTTRDSSIEASRDKLNQAIALYKHPQPTSYRDFETDEGFDDVTVTARERPGRYKEDENRCGIDDSNGLDLTDDERQALTLSVERRLLPAALDYVSRASKAERQIITKALQQGAAATVTEPAVGRGGGELERGPLKAVERWLLSANDKEREVARHFFNSILAAELTGGPSDCGTPDGGAVQRAKLTALLDRLDRERATRHWPLRQAASSGQLAAGSAESIEAVHLKHLRLLSPATRATKWQHQTWHHLPLYTSRSRADNISSHYLRTRKPVSLHFTIHPDWGE